MRKVPEAKSVRLRWSADVCDVPSGCGPNGCGPDDVGQSLITDQAGSIGLLALADEDQ